ncbi:MAG: hypothetical protein GY861_23265 [bacterium]|nr:hypothetical protein [bacterium]
MNKISKLWELICRVNWCSWITIVTLAFMSVLIYVSATVHFIYWGQGKGASPFELAMVSATLGGFLLIGTIIENTPLKNHLMFVRVSIIFLVAALLWVIAGLFFPVFDSLYTQHEHAFWTQVFRVFTATAFILAGGAFALATCWLVTLLPSVWRGAGDLDEQDTD